MEVFPQPYIRPQNPQIISLIDNSAEQASIQTPLNYPVQFQTQTPTTLPIIINKVDYTAVIAIVGILGLFSIIAFLAYLKR